MNFARPTSLFLSLLLALSIGGCAAQSTSPATSTADSARTHLQTAEAMFRERCKTAGEKITRTVDNVEGIFLMKLRPSNANFSSQYLMNDPYGDDVGGDGYLITFLRGRDKQGGSLVDQGGSVKGYRYVEAVNPQDGKRYRYTGSVKEVEHTTSILMGGDGKTKFKTKDYILDKTPATGPQPRFGVTYDDISTKEDRDYWIAGSSLKVIDLKTNEVIAERIGYMMDNGQGSTSGGRAPWLLATRTACPSFPTIPSGQPFTMRQTRNFVEKVLSPKQGN